MIYSDEDKIDANGVRFQPMFKPDWSPELMRSLNLITHLCVFRTEVLRAIGGFRVGFEGSQDYDLSLRFIDRISPETIIHVPHVLYHWRAIPGSVALDSGEKTYAHERARTALTNTTAATASRPVPSAAAATAPAGVSYEPPTVSVILWGEGVLISNLDAFMGCAKPQAMSRQYFTKPTKPRAMFSFFSIAIAASFQRTFLGSLLTDPRPKASVRSGRSCLTPTDGSRTPVSFSG